jgi:hypothetical protein
MNTIASNCIHGIGLFKGDCMTNRKQELSSARIDATGRYYAHSEGIGERLVNG